MTHRKRKTGLAPYIVIAILSCALLCVFYALSTDKRIMESVTSAFSIKVLRAMGSFFSKIPVSFMEVYIAIALLAIIAYIVCFIVFTVKSQRKLITVLKFILILIIAVSLVWNCFCWLWNTGYSGFDFAEKANLAVKGITTEELTAVCRYMVHEANVLSKLVPRDADGVFKGSFADFSGDRAYVYDKLIAEFPFLDGETTVPKGVHFSRIMSRLGFTGVFFPLTGETYINTDFSAWEMPMTIAHEIAHQKGVHPENQCNFLGIAACIQQDDFSWQYSGYASGLIYVMNALYKADYDAWLELRRSFEMGLVRDWKANSEYWAQFEESTVSKASDKVYDTFLKVNKQESGIKSYGECVDMLVTWMIRKGMVL